MADEIDWTKEPFCRPCWQRALDYTESEGGEDVLHYEWFHKKHVRVSPPGGETDD